jgi:hypothetical protein
LFAETIITASRFWHCDIARDLAQVLTYR